MYLLKAKPSRYCPVVVVGNVFPPPQRAARNDGLGILAGGHGHIDVLVAAVHFEDRGNHDNGVVADGLDERRVIDARR